MWRLWAKALGQKASKHNKEADSIAIIRSLIFITYFVTNMFIVSGVIRHWNDSQYQSTSCVTVCKANIK
jgi:hypothetical protein